VSSLVRNDGSTRLETGPRNAATLRMEVPMLRRSAWVGVALFLAVLAMPGRSRYAGPTDWPLDRLIANLVAQLAEHPFDAPARYQLGRAHAFAFALERTTLRVRGTAVVELAEQPRGTDPTSRPMTQEEKLWHLAQGVTHLRKACESEDAPKWMRESRHLTLAWLLEIGAPLGERVDSLTVLAVAPAALGDDEAATLRAQIDDLGSSEGTHANDAREALSRPENLERALPLLIAAAATPETPRQRAAASLVQRYWIERAIAEYWRAFELAIREDLSHEEVSLEAGKSLSDLVSREALDAYTRLVRQRGASPEEEARLAHASEQWKELEAKPRGSWITPILLSLDGCKPLEELITPELAVPFDLDGDGIDELWPWLAPDAGWLVWDPQHRGEITSGRQLFGSASGWLFFQDGYRVLDVLDDDRDGELRGPELAGIAVWFDRDSDGVSDRGEVVPVEALGIVALATTATERIGASLGNPGGLELADGRTLPTYDWVLESRSSP